MEIEIKDMDELLLDENEAAEAHILPIFSPGSKSPFDIFKGEVKDDDILPVLPLRKRVLFPNTMIPVNVKRPAMVKMVRKVSKERGLLVICTQRDAKTENPKIMDLYPTGVAARIIQVMEMPDKSLTIMLTGIERVRLNGAEQEKPYILSRIVCVPEDMPDQDDPEMLMLIDNIRDRMVEIVKMSNMLPDEFIKVIRSMHVSDMVINFCATNFHFSTQEKIEMLNTNSLKDRALQVLTLLNREKEMLDLQASIHEKTHEDLNKQQREYYLHQQMHTIQKELGEDDGGQKKMLEDFRERAKQKHWTAEAQKKFEEVLKRMERLNPNMSDYAVHAEYLETMLALPWEEYTADNYDLERAQKVLDHDHFGMEKPKERVLEHLAVLKMKQDMKAPILCLYGPPGVGKTSLGKSIADALGRKYARVALGGLHDEAELRGHRRTYVGAMPGRILQNLEKVGAGNPVFVLDEVDKIGQDYKGDPTSALLEILDPEQNVAFHDNYLDLDYDLSKVLFIATANKVSDIPAPLRDRMEMIEMSGYLQEEKVEIAKRHLLPKVLKDHGLKQTQMRVGKRVLDYIIEKYTRESGVRELSRLLAQIARKVVKHVAMEEAYNVSVTEADVREYLGHERFQRDQYEGNDYCGVVTGLAWTAVGGEILFIEASTSDSKQFQLSMTGQLGDVMKESVTLAMTYLKAHAKDFGIDLKKLDKTAVHVHVPEGAVPKDGPSAGITITTALVSALTHRKVRRNLAMTGEITLRGKVLPVGGIKEKILAAKRAGITDIMLCQDNQKDIEEINPIYVKGVTFHYVRDIHEVIDFAILN